MQVARQRLVDVLRMAGLLELAREAHLVLPDPVEHNHAELFLAQYGLTKDGLISLRGGSP